MFTNAIERLTRPACLPAVLSSASSELAKVEAHWEATVYVAREVLALVAVALIATVGASFYG